MDINTPSFLTQIRQNVDIKAALEFILGPGGLTHPMVVTACKALGVHQDQIISKPLSTYEDKSNSKEAITARFQQYEARRRARLIVIAEYLVENRIFVPEQKKKAKLRKSNSISEHREKSDIMPALPISPHQIPERRAELYKSSILKRLRFEEKRRKLKAEEILARSEMDKRIREKLAKAEKKLPKNHKFFESQEKRIKEILMKKYNDLDAHELKALNQHQESRREEQKVHNSSIHSSPKKHLTVLFKQDLEDNIELQLLKINSKLSVSAERAKRALISKTSSIALNSLSAQKVKYLREELDNKKEEENVRRLMKMRQSLLDSHVRQK